MHFSSFNAQQLSYSLYTAFEDVEDEFDKKRFQDLDEEIFMQDAREECRGAVG